MKALFISIILLSVFNTVFSQVKPIKWGKISKEEIELKQVSYEPEASAVILCSYGELSFGATSIIVNKHYRIKILTEEGKKYADNSILYYYDKGDKDNINNLKAQTINIDSEGNEIITKVEDKDFYEETVDSDWKKIKFTFPDVQVGSIIEYKYTLNTLNVTFLTAWIFQDEIPVLKSKFSATFPANLIYTYNVFYQGEKLLKNYGSTTSSEWELTNLSGLSDDDYIYNIFDYAELLQFQLSTYYAKTATNAMDGSYETKKFVPSLDELAENMLDNYGYQNYLLFTSKTKDILDNIISTSNTTAEKITKIYTYVNSNYKWNGEYTKFAEKSLAQVLNDKSGSSVEINMLLVSMLKEAGFTVYPVLTSTKDNGKISKEYPIISNFNNIIVAVKIGSVYQLLDATNPFRPYNLLAVNDLNFYGFLLDKTEFKWLDIPIPETTKQTVNVKIDISKPNIQTYEYEFKFEGYYAVEQRKKYIEDSLNYFNNYLIENIDLNIDSFKIENATDVSKSFIVKYWLHRDGNDILENDIAYFEPYNLKKYSENPFNQENRILPVDLGYKYSQNFTLRIYYPENYEVEEFPSAKTSDLVDNTGKFTFNTYKIDNYVKIEGKITIDETLFFPDEYADLKAFHSEIISKFNEQIVLKKK